MFKLFCFIYCIKKPCNTAGLYFDCWLFIFQSAPRHNSSSGCVTLYDIVH